MSERCTAPEASGAFLDRWGHFIIWMFPYITIASLIVGTMDLAIILVGTELLHFFVHVDAVHKGRHPYHQLWVIVIAATIFTAGVVIHEENIFEIGTLVLVQVFFSESVHRNVHAGRDAANWGVTAMLGVITIALLLCLIADGTVPGAFGLKSYLVYSG